MANQEHDGIAKAADELGISVSDRQVAQLVGYLDLLESWNRTYNLTAVRVRDDMLVQHVLDCLAIIRPLAEHAFGLETARRLRCLDVGSGGGLPGVVIAVLFPQVDVMCVDAVGKKASFIRQVALEVGLGNLRAEHSRVELLKTMPFDLIVSRAFASLVDFTRLTERHLKPSGIWCAMKGQMPTAEISALPASMEVFHVEQLAVPRLDADRCLIWIRRGSRQPDEVSL